MHRQRARYVAVAGGLLGRPVAFLKQLHFLALSPDTLHFSGDGKPKPTHVFLTVNGASVELRPITLAWDSKDPRDAVINIAEDMQRIDGRVGAELAKLQK